MSATANLRRDIVSAYLVTGSRLLAYFVVIGAVARVAGKDGFALLGLVQLSVGILEYAAIGLTPAIIRLTAEAIRAHLGVTKTAGTIQVAPLIPTVRAVYANGFAMALLTTGIGAVVALVFMPVINSLDANKDSNNVLLELSAMVAAGTLIRMISDAPGAVLQTRGKIFLDNILLTLHECVWMVGTVIGIRFLHLPWQRATGFALMTGSCLLLMMRTLMSHRHGSGVFHAWWKQVDRPTIRRLLVFGGMVVAAQMADYLYAPTDNAIITDLLGWKVVGDYGPAVQIDGGMLLVASALASVLLPRTALAHASGDGRAVRQYYIYGTLTTTAILLVAAPIICLISPWLFKLWLDHPFSATVAILPYMMIHTVIGGSSAVGRSILLAIGKVRPFTISVVVAGVVNVICSYCFVRFLHLGLRGIVLGTIVAVTGRCAIWLPWYTWKVLKEMHPVEEDAMLV